MNSGASTCQLGVVSCWNILCTLLVVPCAGLIWWTQMYPLVSWGYCLTGTLHLAACMSICYHCSKQAVLPCVCHKQISTNLFYLHIYIYMNDLGLFIIIIYLTKLSVNHAVNYFIFMHLAVLIPTYLAQFMWLKCTVWSFKQNWLRQSHIGEYN